MPKKRTLNLKQFQGSPSTNSRTAGQDGGDSPTASVNERLADLRKLESLDAQQKKRELAEAANQKSVPPDLRSILGVAETAPPKLKVSMVLRERMRTPGPATPKSWLGFRSAWDDMGKRKGRSPPAVYVERNRTRELGRFARLAGLDQDFDGSAKPSSLMHLALKRLAIEWERFHPEDYPALVEIPFRLRMRLLTYIGFYGPLIDAASLQALTQGSDEITYLDLAGLAGHASLPISKLTKILKADQVLHSAAAGDEIVDAWDAEDVPEAELSTLTPFPRFANMTHLCLSHPPPSAHWRDLLALTKHVPQLTHLSLAYWPRPTLTPNLVTAVVSSQRSPEVHAGGSHYYSNLDQNYSEPASVLRQLSFNLLCLQWLDLEGCADWIPALAALNMGEDESPATDDGIRWTGLPVVVNVFSCTWKNLIYINCSQGWMPSLVGIRGLEDLGRHVAGIREDLEALIDKDHAPAEALSDVYDTEKRRAKIWVDLEAQLLFAGRRINSIRRVRKCKPVVLDFGWRQKAV